ncbi:MAG: hypothetical protein II453_06510 [Alphaproteobacteria bacterium]|nr:hypothetical protein [Alphaproteobacteria bacterium]
MDYKILIKEGLDDIRFGMPVEQVVSILGDAEEVESMENATDEITTILHYDDGALTLFFEGENPILQCIDLSAEESTLFGERIFDMNEKEIVKLMVSNNYYEQDADEEAWGERRISFGEGNIDFFLENDELIAIVYGC